MRQGSQLNINDLTKITNTLYWTHVQKESYYEKIYIFSLDINAGGIRLCRGYGQHCGYC